MIKFEVVEVLLQFIYLFVDPYDQDYRQTYGQGQQQKDVYRGTTNYQGRQYGSNTYPQRYADDIKRLRLLWDEHGGYVEYNIRYNTSIPGFWMCSGPQSGRFERYVYCTIYY